MMDHEKDRLLLAELDREALGARKTVERPTKEKRLEAALEVDAICDVVSVQKISFSPGHKSARNVAR